MTTKLSDEQLREIVRHGFIFHGAPDNLSAMAEELLSLRELERRVLAAVPARVRMERTDDGNFWYATPAGGFNAAWDGKRVLVLMDE